MPFDEKMNEIIFEQLSVEKEKNVPCVSFLDDLDSKTFEAVELIMASGTGQKDIVRQLKLSASTL